MATISKIKISSKEVEVVTADNKANLTVKFENTLPYQLIPLSVLSQISNISSYQGELSINDILNIIIERFHHNIFFTFINKNILTFAHPYLDNNDNIFNTAYLQKALIQDDSNKEAHLFNYSCDYR